MRALSIMGEPGKPVNDVLVIFVLVAILFLPGCTERLYQAVPECIVAAPPKAERFVEAGVDEKLVMMTGSYIDQTKSIANCNNTIRLINSSNKASK